MIEYVIAKEYTEIPGPRLRIEGNYSGEDFRENILIPLVKQTKTENEKILIDLDGGYGYPTSFLEEAFGGLVRVLKDKQVIEIFEFKSDEEPALINEIKEYMRREMGKL